MKRKLLVMSTRLLEPSENHYDKRFFCILRALLRDFEVHYLYTQSMFVNEISIKAVEEAGIQVLSLKALKDKATGGLEKQLEVFFAEGSYDVVLMNAYFTAKYYIPFLQMYSPSSIVVIDVSRSQYLSELNFASKSIDIKTRASLQKNVEVSKMKEVSVYSYVDLVIADDEAQRAALESEVPLTPVCIVPKLAKDEGNTASIVAAVETIVPTLLKRPSNSRARPDIVVLDTGIVPVQVKTDMLDAIKDVITTQPHLVEPVAPGNSQVAAYNAALKKMTAEFGLIMTTGAVMPAETINPMIHCVQSHPANGIVATNNNTTLGSGLRINDLFGFFPKHYAANFGHWHTVRRIVEPCLLFRTEIFQKAGYLDTRYETLDIALFDLCQRIYQIGYRIILMSEAFVYYAAPIPQDKERLKNDRKLLYDKWCDKGIEFLEMLSE